MKNILKKLLPFTVIVFFAGTAGVKRSTNFLVLPAVSLTSVVYGRQ
jgi:hypothetical protein